MVTCSETKTVLWELLDGELDVVTAGDAFAHLRACEHCRAQYDADLAFLGAVACVRDSDTASHALRRRVTEALRVRGLLS